ITSRAGTLHLSRAAAPRAIQSKLHRPGHLRHIPAAATLRASHRTARTSTAPMAGRAHIVTGNIDPRLRSLNRLPEIDIQRVLKIGALLRLMRLRTSLAPLTKKLAENVAKSAAIAPAGRPFRSTRT